MDQSPRKSGVEIRHLRLIVALAEHGSLTSVARLLGLTQPALSHQLRDLEGRLRAPLFERTARRMVLTPVGGLTNALCKALPVDVCAALGPSLFNLQNVLALLGLNK